MLMLCGLVLTAGQAQRVYQYLSLLDWSAQLTLLWLGTLGLSEVLLPSSTFLGVLYVFRIAWRRGYISTLFSCGYSPWQINRGLLLLTCIVTLCTAVCSHYVGPIALTSLKQGFIHAFQSGQVHPIAAIPFGEKGGLEISSKDGEVLGVFQSEGTINMVHAEGTRFAEVKGAKQIQFKHVHAANRFVSIETERLTITLAADEFHAFPKVLRGTKLISTDKLRLDEHTHQYASLRRWVLTLLVAPLLLLAGVLPRFFGDVALVCVGGVCLAAIHMVLRSIELARLDGVALVMVMLTFVGCAYGTALWTYWRTYWRI